MKRDVGMKMGQEINLKKTMFFLYVNNGVTTVKDHIMFVFSIIFEGIGSILSNFQVAY